MKDLRETSPLPQDLARWGSDRIQWYNEFQRMTEAGYEPIPGQRMSEVNLNYPLTGRDSAKSGLGQ
jgi:hypothetical protein